MTPPKPKLRDTTRALMLVAVLRHQLSPDSDTEVKTNFDELEAILTQMDARTGRRDPSTRKRVKKS